MRVLTYLCSRNEKDLTDDELDIKIELTHLYNRPEYN